MHYLESSNQPNGALLKSHTSRKSNTEIIMNYYLKVLENYATFSGRARRSEYWYFCLVNFVVAFVIGFIGGLTKIDFLGNIYTLAIVVPSIAVGVRRMHDVGKSGWFLLIPIYNFILACTAGEIGTNEYGENPKDNN